MSNIHTHLIHREVIEWSAPHLRIARKVEEDSGRLIEKIIHPVLAQCIEELIPADVQLTVENMVLDLGVLHAGSLEKELESRLRHCFLRELRTKHQNAIIPAASQSGSTGEQDQKANHTMHIKDAISEGLFQYLINGVPPWWWNPETSPMNSWQALAGRKLARHVLSIFKTQHAAISRGVHVLSDAFLDEIIQEAGYGRSVLQGWNEILQNPAASRTRVMQCRDAYWEYCMERCCYPALATESRNRKCIDHLHQTTTLTRAELEFFFTTVFIKHERAEWDHGHLERSELLSATGDEVRETSDHLLDSGNDPNEASRPSSHELSSPLGKDGLPNDSSVRKEKKTAVHRTPESLKERNPKEVGPSAAEGSIAVNNAGLVLVHPFLKELFRVRGLVENGEFVFSETQCLGVRMLDFLCTGSGQSPEYDLLLPKLLCGMPWSESIPHEIQIGEDDMSACVELLNAVLSHWSVLKNTSPDGLREGFMIRPGVLEQQENGWKLRVEERAQDVLLGRLPWGLSLVRLPWMQQSLHISWA